MNNSFHVLHEANRNITALLIGNLTFEVHQSPGYVLRLDWRYGHNILFPSDSRELGTSGLIIDRILLQNYLLARAHTHTSINTHLDTHC